MLLKPWRCQNALPASTSFLAVRLLWYLPTLKILRTEGCISTLLGTTPYLQLSWFSHLTVTQELFMVTLTHDLRGPLNVLKMGTQLTLRRLERGDTHVDVAARMISAINRLDSMIQNLLDARRLRAGQSLKIEFEECDLDRLVQDVAEDLSFAYGERFFVVSDSDLRSYCSRKEIRRMIENLAINAVKYGTPRAAVQ